MANKKSKTSKELEKALREYAACIKEKGWEAGEPIIEKYKDKYPNFDKLALAMRVLIRAEEILKEERKKGKK